MFVQFRPTLCAIAKTVYRNVGFRRTRSAPKFIHGLLHKSWLYAEQKLSLLLERQLAVEIDAQGFLQLNPQAEYQLKAALSPVDFFFVLLRQLVVVAYRRQNLNNTELGSGHLQVLRLLEE